MTELDELNIMEEIQNDLASMTIEEKLKLKEELGTKIYNEVILDVSNRKLQSTKIDNRKHLSKDAPLELDAKRQAPFLGAELRRSKLLSSIRDPRFDVRAGKYKPWHFKKDYKFVNDIREQEINKLRKELSEITHDDEKRQQLKEQIKRLHNKNIEEHKWHAKQINLKQEREQITRSIAAGQQPHFLTKKERRTKELVTQFEELKSKGALNKHLEKRRKKNAAKDRRKIHLD